jgi:hypothetical protein
MFLSLSLPSMRALYFIGVAAVDRCKIAQIVTL